MKCIIPIICIILVVSGCVNKHIDVLDNIVLEQNKQEVPFWVGHSFIESNNYFYIIGTQLTDFHTPSFAYKKTRKVLYRFFEQESHFILGPLKKTMSKVSLKSLSDKYIEYISGQLLKEIRENKMIFWQKVKYLRDGEYNVGYRYHILLAIPKDKLRSVERNFLYLEEKSTYFSKKSLFEKQLKYCFQQIELLIANDNIKNEVLIEDILFTEED